MAGATKDEDTARSGTVKQITSYRVDAAAPFKRARDSGLNLNKKRVTKGARLKNNGSKFSAADA